MRIAKVPIDMASEQRNIMGIVSTRQLIYLIIGGSIIYSYLFPLFQIIQPIVGIIISIIICVVSAVPIIAIVVYFGFLKIEKYNMFRDYYLLIKIQRKTQYGMWRKGN